MGPVPVIEMNRLADLPGLAPRFLLLDPGLLDQVHEGAG